MMAIVPGAFVPPGSDLNSAIAFSTVSDFTFAQSTSSAARSEPATVKRAIVINMCFFIFSEPTSDYTDLDIIPFWGDIQAAPVDEKFPLIKAYYCRCGAHCKPNL